MDSRLLIHREPGGPRFEGEIEPVRVIRPADLLNLVLHFRNLQLRRRGTRRPPLLVRTSTSSPGLLIAELPPQHITELAFFEDSEGLPAVAGRDGDPDNARTTRDTLELPPVRSVIGGPARLAFEVHNEEIEFSVAGLLDALTRLDLRVTDAARPRRSKVMVPPWWLDSVDLVDAIFVGARLKPARHRTAADVIGAHRLLKTTAALTERFGPQVAAAAVAASDREPLFGRIRKELLVELADPIRVRRRPSPSDPGADRTGIELPWRLIVSPHAGAAFAHSAAEVEHGGRVELWHSRLGLRTRTPEGEPVVDEHSTYGRSIRAVWTRDFEWWRPTTPDHLPPVDGSGDQPAFRMALNANDRISIVHLTADWTQEAEVAPRRFRPYEPEPVEVNRLMVSALGGWVDSLGTWDPPRPGPLSVEEWRHRAAMGRDFEVQVVRAGFLFPFGHRASLVKVTERKFPPDVSGTPAYLFQRMFVIVRQQMRSYADRELVHDDPKRPQRNGERVDLQFPFKTVTLTTRVTPLLDEPRHLITKEGRTSGDAAMDSALKGDSLFFPYVGGTAFAFKAIAVDLEDNQLEFGVPLLFVGAAHNASIDRNRAISRLYDDDTKDDRTTARLRGQKLAFAPSDRPDDTTLNVASITFGGDAPPGIGFGQIEPRFAPRVKEANAIVPAVAHLAGNAAPARVIYGERYRRVQANPGQVFLDLPDKLKMDFASQSDRSGALVAPSLSVSGISKLTGPIGGDPAQFASGAFSAEDFFSGIQARLFGAIDLWKLLDNEFNVDKLPAFVTQSLDAVGILISNLERAREALSALGAQAQTARQQAQQLVDGIAATMDPSSPDPANLDALASDLGQSLDTIIANLPGTSVDQATERSLDALLRRVKQLLDDFATVGQLLDDFKRGFELPEVLSAQLEWRPDLRDWPAGAPLFKLHRKANGQPKGGLVLAVDLQAPTGPGREPAVDVTCALSEFDLRLLGNDAFLILDFEGIEFLMRAGRKPDVEVNFRGVQFAGVLEFVETLRKLIPLDGFSDPPGLDVSPQGISASYSVALPNVAVGVLSLENLSLAAKLRVPFIGESLDASFLFCTREDPFRLTVMLFGGGGFFGITVTPAGVKQLEAAFEFGAAVSLNFGVASGSLSVMAGIYFRMELVPTENAALTGYFRARGEVDVMGLISASIELYLELTYEFPTKKAAGRATLKIEVEVLFFSATVQITCEKKFAGANSDPTLEQAMARGLPGRRPWDEYCKAFARVA